MKKISKIVLALVAAVTLFGCKGQVENKEKEVSLRNNLSKTYISMIELQKGAAEAGIEAVSKYVDIEDLSSRSLATDDIELTQIGDYLPADLSTLKRTVKNDSRNAETEADEQKVEEITLQDELSAIVEQFNNSLEELIPNPEKALSLPFVSEVEDGLLIGDDMIIPYKSIEGAVTVELLNAMADGEDIEELVEQFEQDIESELDLEESSRSLWHMNTVAWKRGEINYRWGNISDDHKQAVIDAMKEWSDKTEKVSFNEIDDKPWTNFLLKINTIGCVCIDNQALGNDSGKSTIGYYGGNTSFLHLNPIISGDQLTHTALHELGHVLGLHHEHQRYDRDDYLILTEQEKQSEAFKLIPKDFEKFTWIKKKIKILWWYATINVLTFKNVSNCYYSSNFDFDSVMLYDGLDVNPDKKYLNHNNDKTNCNTTISKKDIEMIKSRY